MAELGCSEIAPVHAIIPENAVPTDGANVGGQNSYSQFISRVETACSGFGVVGGKMGK